MNTNPNTFLSVDPEAMSSHRELFNKLVASHSQPSIIVGGGTLGEEQNPSTDQTRCLSANEQINQDKIEQQRRCATSNGPLVSRLVLDHRNVYDLLPDDFKKVPVAFAEFRNRWYTNEEVASILTNFNSHPEWQTNELQIRPKSGAVYLYSREKVRYRQDGYCWKKRKNGRTTREDHMKLKVQGIECIYGCYVHSAILPTFHRRCYWLLQNPDIVLVHYLNQPPDDQNKMMITFNSSSLEAYTRRSWTNEDIIEEIGSVFGGISQIKHMLNINLPAQSAPIQQQPQQNQSDQQQQQQQQGLDQQQSNQQQQQLQEQELQEQQRHMQQIQMQPNDLLMNSCNQPPAPLSNHQSYDADENTQHTCSSSSMDLIALGDSFGHSEAPIGDESDLHAHQLQHQQQQRQQHQHDCSGAQVVVHEIATIDDNNTNHDNNNDCDDDDLLLSDFNLQTSSLGQVDEELVSNVIESLSNVEDLRDLLVGITSNESEQQLTQLGVSGDNESSDRNDLSSTGPTSSYDLFDFKPDQAYQRYNNNHIDARSSISETDSLLVRPSPSAPVSRSNSTGNYVNSCNMSHISWSSYDSGTS